MAIWWKMEAGVLKNIQRAVATALVAALIVVSVPTVAFGAVVGPPTALSPTAGNNQVALTWTAPAVGANPAITDYIVEYTTNLGVTWTSFLHNASATTSITVTSLTNGAAYTFRVRAVNSDGSGSTSTAVTATPVSDHTPNDLATYLACPTDVAPAANFTDVTSTSVDCIKYYEITRGTTDTTYSPQGSVTRWQMALFLTRMAVPAGITLGSGADQGFTDIVGKSTEIQTAINQIKQLGITVGKTATTYGPDDDVTREEMALFLTRLLKKATPGPGGNIEYVSTYGGPTEIKSNDTDHNFTDMSSLSLWESTAAIANLWNLGVTESATATVYEPSKKMTRQAMATMMTNALGHTNARPKGLSLQANTYRVAANPAISFSVSYRGDDFLPIANTPVDTFRFTYSIVTTKLRFDSYGKCSSTDPTSVGSTECTVDASDPKTGIDGNLAVFSEYMPALNKVDFWAWTSALGTQYDNDIHAAEAEKVTVETTATP